MARTRSVRKLRRRLAESESHHPSLLTEWGRVRVTWYTTYGAPGESERAPDPVRRWHRDRLAASHDLLHTLTGYGRDIAGEAALLAFSLGFAPIRIFRLSLVLAFVGAPKRRPAALARYLYRAWKRGRSAKISLDIHWEELLAAPFDAARARLAIAPVQTVHPEGVWCGDRGSSEWRPERDAN